MSYRRKIVTSPPAASELVPVTRDTRTVAIPTPLSSAGSSSDLVLVHAAYAPGTLQRYRNAYAQFHDYVRSTDWSIRTYDDLDSAATAYCLYKYRLGYAAAAGAQLGSALSLFLPDTRGRLPYFALSVRGWRRLKPSVRHPPVPKQVAAAVAFRCLHWGYPHVAVAILLAFHCMLRIGEYVNLRVSDVVDAGNYRFGYANDAMILRLRRTKGGPNQDVTVTDPELMALMRLVIGNRHTTAPESKVFGFSEDQFRKCFRHGLRCYGLDNSDIVPHSLRHGGCTHSFVAENADVSKLMIRGRWKELKSFRHYLQQSKASLIALQTPRTVIDFGDFVLSDLRNVFRCALRVAKQSREVTELRSIARLQESSDSFLFV